MFHEREAREHVEAFPDLLDYFAQVDNGTAFLKSGVFLAVWEFVGYDTNSQTLAERFHLANRFANALNLGEDFGVSCDVIRVYSTDYLPVPASLPDPITCLIEEERRVQFTTPGNYFQNRAFFALTYRPVPDPKAKATNWLFEVQEGNQDGFGAQALETFNRAADQLDAVLQANLRQARRLRCYEQNGYVCDELHRYIRLCIFGQDEPFVLPEIPMHLASLFAAPLVGGDIPQIDGKYHAVIAINGFPANSFAGIFQPLLCLPFPYRFTQQSELLGAQQASAFYAKLARQWGFKKIPFITRLINKQSAVKDGMAAKLEQEADDAKNAAEYQTVIDLFYTAKIVLAHEDLNVLRARIKKVIEALAPFKGRHETDNALAAIVSSYPGHMHRDPRYSAITTQNLAHFLPIGAPSRGPKFNPSPLLPKNTPPLLLGSAAAGSLPVNLHLHVEDKGHVFLSALSGAGKTTALAKFSCCCF
jgi:type IV secretory pathway VirB4 component